MAQTTGELEILTGSVHKHLKMRNLFLDFDF